MFVQQPSSLYSLFHIPTEKPLPSLQSSSPINTMFFQSFVVAAISALAVVSAAPTEKHAEKAGLVARATGQGTWYNTGLGACGISSKDSEYVVAVSAGLYDTYPGYTGGNPNNNPICKKKIKATYQGKSVTVTIVDRCTGCAFNDLDFSPTAFSVLAPTSAGRISGVTWNYV